MSKYCCANFHFSCIFGQRNSTTGHQEIMKDIAQDRSLEVSEMLVETITDLEVIRENRQIKIRNKSRSCSRGNEKHIMSICTHLDVLWKVCFFAAEGRCQQRCPEQSRLPSANSKGLVSFFIFFASLALIFVMQILLLHSSAFDLPMLYLSFQCCAGFPVSAALPEAHREMFHFKQGSL